MGAQTIPIQEAAYRTPEHVPTMLSCVHVTQLVDALNVQWLQSHLAFVLTRRFHCGHGPHCPGAQNLTPGKEITLSTIFQEETRKVGKHGLKGWLQEKPQQKPRSTLPGTWTMQANAQGLPLLQFLFVLNVSADRILHCTCRRREDARV